MSLAKLARLSEGLPKYLKRLFGNYISVNFVEVTRLGSWCRVSVSVLGLSSFSDMVNCVGGYRVEV